jgi:hypothetical protein
VMTPPRMLQKSALSLWSVQRVWIYVRRHGMPVKADRVQTSYNSRSYNNRSLLTTSARGGAAEFAK